MAITLLPVVSAVAVVFLITGAALPALPLHISNLGFGPSVVGAVTGAQFLASLIARVWSGNVSDRHGPKLAVMAGLGMAVAAGLIYIASLALAATPVAAIAVLLVGRALLGGAESFIITGAQSWGLTLAGPGNAGKAIAWIGTAMYVALAAGAPIGSLLYARYGFVIIGIVTVALSLVAALIVKRLTPVHPLPQAQRKAAAMIRAVLLPGIGLAFASVGLGAMTAFAVLLFTQNGWSPAWLSFSLFALTFVAARLCLGGLPDKIGGARAAVIFSILQGLGLAMIWMAPDPMMGFLGAAMTGLGYSFVYPGLGLVVVQSVPFSARGSAMGLYTAFLDFALGVLSPMLGLLASAAGLASVFGISAFLSLCTVPMALLTKSGRK